MKLNFTIDHRDDHIGNVKVGSVADKGFLRASKKLTPGKWQHLVVSFQTKDNKVLVRILLDGEVIAEGTNEGRIHEGKDQSPSLTVGRDAFQRGDSRAFGMFRGLQIYDPGLDVEEIAKLATAR